MINNGKWSKDDGHQKLFRIIIYRQIRSSLYCCQTVVGKHVILTTSNKLVVGQVIYSIFKMILNMYLIARNTHFVIYYKTWKWLKINTNVYVCFSRLTKLSFVKYITESMDLILDLFKFSVFVLLNVCSKLLHFSKKKGS